MKKLIALFAWLPYFSFAQAPVNDVPCGAITIPVVSSNNCTPSTIYSWANATFSTGGTSNPACGGFTGTTKDVWFKFTPITANCAILFDQAYAISHDLAASVYDAESCTFFYSFTLCNDDDGPANYPQFSFDNLIPGATYYLRVWQYNPAIDSGSAKICIVSEPVPPVVTGKTGINTLFPATALDVNGVVKIRGGAPGLNKVLTSDAIGTASWKVIPVPTKVVFGTYLLPGTSQSIPSSTFTKLLFGEPEETGVANFASGVFTAPETAVYHFETFVTVTLSSATNVSVRIVITDASNAIIRSYESRENNSAASTEKTFYVSATTALTAGYKAEVQFFHNTGSPLTISNTGTLGVDRKTRFQGYKL